MPDGDDAQGCFFNPGSDPGTRPGVKVGEGRLDATVPMMFSGDETTDLGGDTGTPVTDDFGSTGKNFTGRVKWVEQDIGGAADDQDLLITPEERMRVAMARQ
ncbi:MAG: hypothetical protein LH650_16515 [Chloroflexi bacterium]|nr:hypothetical protein [Chloroflexota bacterium]